MTVDFGKGFVSVDWPAVSCYTGRGIAGLAGGKSGFIEFMQFLVIIVAMDLIKF